MKGGGGARSSEVSLHGNGAAPPGVGDVGGMSVGVDGGMERGDAQILPPLGVGKVLG